MAHTALALGPRLGLQPDRLRRPRPLVSRGALLRRLGRRADVRALPVGGRARGVARGLARSGPPRPSAGRERLVQLPGWDGHPLPSSFHFSMCQRWFEETARRMAGTVRLLQLQRGGRVHRRHAPHQAVRAGQPPATAHPVRADGSRLPRHRRRWIRRSRRRAARERLVELMLELRRCPALSASELAWGGSDAVPLLSALVEAELRGRRSLGPQKGRPRRATPSAAAPRSCAGPSGSSRAWSRRSAPWPARTAARRRCACVRSPRRPASWADPASPGASPATLRR